MEESMCVNLTGSVLSYLMFENLRYFEGSQEGFLLGNVSIHKERIMTDDREIIKLHRHINIDSMIPCPNVFFFYNSSGNVVPSKIDELLRDKKSKVVAWYRFSTVNAFRLTLREKILLKNLAAYFNPSHPEYFLTCLLNAKKKPNVSSTHVFSQTFVRYHRDKIQPVLLNIVKLNNKCDEYKKQPLPSYTKELLDSIKDHSTMSGYNLVRAAEKVMQEKIAILVKELIESERKMYSIDKEVKEMRQSIASLNYYPYDNDWSKNPASSKINIPTKIELTYKKTQQLLKLQKEKSMQIEVKECQGQPEPMDRVVPKSTKEQLSIEKPKNIISAIGTVNKKDDQSVPENVLPIEKVRVQPKAETVCDVRKIQTKAENKPKCSDIKEPIKKVEVQHDNRTQLNEKLRIQNQSDMQYRLDPGGKVESKINISSKPKVDIGNQKYKPDKFSMVQKDEINLKVQFESKDKVDMINKGIKDKIIDNNERGKKKVKASKDKTKNCEDIPNVTRQADISLDKQNKLSDDLDDDLLNGDPDEAGEQDLTFELTAEEENALLEAQDEEQSLLLEKENNKTRSLSLSSKSTSARSLTKVNPIHTHKLDCHRNIQSNVELPAKTTIEKVDSMVNKDFKEASDKDSLLGHDKSISADNEIGINPLEIKEIKDKCKQVPKNQQFNGKPEKK